jgi:hypothetical protein
MADEKKEVVEFGKNCGSCKKVLKKKKRYYRNGVYYCNSNCYKKKMAENTTKEAEAKAESAEKAAA